MGAFCDPFPVPFIEFPPDFASDLLGLSGSRTSTMICEPEGVLVGDGDETGDVVAELFPLAPGLRRKYSFAALFKLDISMNFVCYKIKLVLPRWVQ